LEDFTDRTGIKVSDVTFRQEDLQTILPLQFAASRTPADVIFMASGFIRDWGIDGHAVDMSGTLDEANYLEGALDPISSGTAVYGGAFTGKVKPGFWYKNDLFTSKGWDTTPANFAAFQALLADIATDMTPIVSGDGVGWPLSDVTEHFIATYGGAAMHKGLVSGAKAFTDADVKAVFADRLVPLLSAGYFGPLVEWTAGVKNLQDEVNALYFQGSWLPTMSQITDTGTTDNMRAMALPGGVADQGVVFSVDYVFVPTYTTRMADAQAFFDYLMSVAGQEKQIEQGGHFATHVDADPSKAPPTFSGDLIAGKEILADLDDTIGGSFQTTFWAQLQLLWADPSALDAVLAAIEAAR
jgi:multiple sugar transport system substrate-binding protein